MSNYPYCSRSIAFFFQTFPQVLAQVPMGMGREHVPEQDSIEH